VTNKVPASKTSNNAAPPVLTDATDRTAPFHQDFARKLRDLADEVDRGGSSLETLRILDAIKLILLGATIAADSAHRVGRMTLLRALDRTVDACHNQAIVHAQALQETGAVLTGEQERLAAERAPHWADPAYEWSVTRGGRRYRTPKHEVDRIKQSFIAAAIKKGPTMSDEQTAQAVRLEFAWPFATRSDDGVFVPELLANVPDKDLVMAVRIWTARGAPRRTTARPEKWPFLADLCACAGFGRVSAQGLQTDWQDWTGSGFRTKSRRKKG